MLFFIPFPSNLIQKTGLLVAGKGETHFIVTPVTHALFQPVLSRCGQETGDVWVISLQLTGCLLMTIEFYKKLIVRVRKNRDPEPQPDVCANIAG
jgi:hypothetical protein